MRKRSVLLAVLLLTAAAASAAMAEDYKLVLKDRGRVVSGAFVSEDSTSVIVEIGGIRTRFQKNSLDLTRMKELNKGQPGKSPQPPQPSQPASSAVASESGPHHPYEPYDLYNLPQMHAALKDQQRSFRGEVDRLQGVIIEWGKRPPYPNKEKDIEGFKRTLRQQEWELEGYNIELGESRDRVATELFARMIEAARAAAREHREYFEAVDRKAPLAELEDRSKRITMLTKEAEEAQRAFYRYRQESKEFK